MEYKEEKDSYFGNLTRAVGSLTAGMKTSIRVFFRKKITEQYPENRKELRMFDRFRGTLSMPHNENNEHRCAARSEEHTSELQSRQYLVCRLLLVTKILAPTRSSISSSPIP